MSIYLANSSVKDEGFWRTNLENTCHKTLIVITAIITTSTHFNKKSIDDFILFSIIYCFYFLNQPVNLRLGFKLLQKRSGFIHKKLLIGINYFNTCFFYCLKCLPCCFLPYFF